MNSATASGTTRRAPRRSAWRITLAYIGIGAAWIVLTDIASLGFGSRAGGPIVTVSMVKGIFWIVASGLLLHILVFERVERARAFEIAVRRRLLEGEEIGRFGVAESFADDRRARWSEGMFRLWGRSIAEGEPDAEWLARHVAPDDLPRALAAADAAARGEAVPPYEIRIHSDDGSGRYLRITTRTETADGRTRTLVLAQDVTEVRALERNAAESLGLLRSVLESTAEGIIVVRIDTRELLLWNERFLELSHVPREVVERLDSRASVTEFVARARNEEQVRAWIDEIYRNPEAECVDLIEMKDGTILERHTAPVLIEGQPRARIWSFRDVTDRIRATEALRRRERALAESQKIGHLGSFEWRLDTEDVFFSEEMSRIFGLPHSLEPIPVPELLAMVVPDDAPAFFAALEAAGQEKAVNGVRYRIVRPDGAVRLLEGRGEFFRGDGAGRAYLGTVQDVTEEHAARQALIEAEERFRATFEQAAVGIAHLSPDRRILRVNETLCSVLGYDRDELVGTVAAELIHPDDRARSAAEVEALLRRDSPSRSWELRYRKKSGGYLWAEVTISAARLDGGSSYLIAVAQDVTERKRIEEERERLARQVRLLLASTGAGLFTVDLDGRCTLINRAACESLGYSEKEIVGRPIREVLYGGRAKVPAEATSAIESANAGEATKLYNQRFNRRDGSTLPVDLTVSPIVEDGIVIGRAVSFVDVSDRMRLEQQLEEAKRLSSLGRLAASIAHEINNVLMGILPFAEIVTRSKEQTFRNAGEQIRQSVQRGRGVTQEILRFARDEAPHRHVFEGRTWFRSIAGELQEIAGRRAWSLKLPDQPFHLNADPSQLAQVLINLVANARDAVDPASGRIEVSVTLANPGTTFSFGALPQRGHRWVAIRVTDNGAGMDADTLAHLFEPFFTKKRGGTGLGLPIAYKIVAAHEGLLFVESAEGKGSSFFLFLSEADAPARESDAAIAEESRLSGDVLLVEDDETVAAGLAHILEEAGMRVRIARNGTEAITELERARPTVMVLDVGLPDMHGEAVCAHALARWPGLPIVFSTGHAEASRLRTWLEKPNVRFLMKPYTFEQLSEAIGEAMNGKR